MGSNHCIERLPKELVDQTTTESYLFCLHFYFLCAEFTMTTELIHSGILNFLIVVSPLLSFPSTETQLLGILLSIRVKAECHTRKKKLPGHRDNNLCGASSGRRRGGTITISIARGIYANTKKGRGLFFLSKNLNTSELCLLLSASPNFMVVLVHHERLRCFL